MYWEERFYTPPPPGSNFRDCKCDRFKTKASIHHPLWVVVVYIIALPIYVVLEGLEKPADARVVERLQDLDLLSGGAKSTPSPPIKSFPSKSP